MNDHEALVVRGQIVDPRDEEIAALEADVKRLRRELAIANGEIAHAKGDAARALGALRKQLSPLYRALQSVFGELDAAGADDSQGGEPANTRTSAVWNSWKSKMPGRPSEIIDLLLVHGEMNRNQLMAAMHVGKDVVRVTVSKLNVAGLLNKNGGRFSLKQLS